MFLRRTERERALGLKRHLHTYLQLSGLFKLFKITLSLEGGIRCQKDILCIVIDIFLPHGQPSDCIVMLN